MVISSKLQQQSHRRQGPAARRKIRKYTDTASHDRKNLEAALVIVSEADRYGGEEALAVQWARRVIARLDVRTSLHSEAA